MANSSLTTHVLGWLRRYDLVPHQIIQAIVPRSARVARVRRVAPGRPGATRASQRMLYVDLSVIGVDDAGTGIQRVVRALALALAKRPAADWTICFVAATRYHAYHRIAWPDEGGARDLTPIAARPGDVFLGLDYALDAVRRHRRQLSRFRRAGGSVWFLVHDLLPLQRPEWFSAKTVARYDAWLNILASLGDGFFCNSRQTESELRAELHRYPIAPDSYRTQVLPMGHDIAESVQDTLGGARVSTRIRDLAARDFLLKVGTLEPRKGHLDLLRAFDILWQRGSDEELLFIGRLGWDVAHLRDALLSHREFGRRLHWLDDVDDAELIEAYRAARGVLVASYAEGFGLPLIEALGHGKAVLARDLPIFHEYESAGVRFFPAGATPEILADVVASWLTAVRAGQVNVAPPKGTWAASASQLLVALASV